MPIALAVTALNSALALVVLRSPSAPGTSSERPAYVDPSPSLPVAPLAARAPEGTHPSLDEAWTEVARGEYAAARQRAYSLLALVDGIEGAERARIEGDCRYLIAQALYLDALARREAAR